VPHSLAVMRPFLAVQSRKLLRRSWLIGTTLGLAATVNMQSWLGRRGVTSSPIAMASATSGAVRAPGPFGKKSTAREVAEAFSPNRALAGCTAVVTGGNSGIGLETAKALALAGCRVVLASRDVAAGERAVESEIRQSGLGGYAVPDADVVVKKLDLADLGSVASFAADLLATEQRLDYVVLNAGVMAIPTLSRTADGFETQIGTNHFGHAMLTRLLMPKLEAQEHRSRVVVLASTAHTMASNLDVGNLHYTLRDGAGYSAWGAYGASKLANVLFASALSRRLPKDRVTATSVHPGVIRTPLWRSTPASNSIGGWLLDRIIANKDIPQGASTTVWACLSPEAADPGNAGAYLSDCALERASALGRDDGLAEALWRATDQQLDAALAKRGLDRMGKAPGS